MKRMGRQHLHVRSSSEDGGKRRWHQSRILDIGERPVVGSETMQQGHNEGALQRTETTTESAAENTARAQGLGQAWGWGNLSLPIPPTCTKRGHGWEEKANYRLQARRGGAWSVDSASDEEGTCSKPRQ
jgi:hypothetical protein